MGTISTYILVITLVSLEVFAFVNKEFTFKFTGIIALVYVVQILMMFVSDVSYFLVMVYLVETLMLNVLLFLTIVSRFQTDEEDDE